MSETELQAENNEEGNGKKEAESIFISKEDRLVAENLHLRVVNLAHEARALQEQLQQKTQQLQKLQQDIGEKRSELEVKYNIDLATHEIRESDGQVMPRTAQNSVARVMQQLGQEQRSPNVKG